MSDRPTFIATGPRLWYRLVADPAAPLEPVAGPSCSVCGEPMGSHRSGWYAWDDGRSVPACFADVDRLGAPHHHKES